MKKFNAVIDRFEEDKAVIITKDNSSFVMFRKLLPVSAKEGDALTFLVKINNKESRLLKKKMKSAIRRLDKSR